ncbi:MAG: stage II sporulation protein E [Clostridiales bacterium]|nr:stage II sporulation protein E [Clostridiales bacterium]
MEKQGYSYYGTIAAADRVTSGLNRKSTPGTRYTGTKKKYGYILSTVFIVLSCFFMGRAFILENIAPFCLAFYSAILSRQRGRLVAFVSVLGGMLSVSIGGFIFKYALAMGFLFLIYNLVEKTRLGNSKFFLAFMTASILSLISLVYKAIIPGGILFYDYMLTAFEAAIVFALVYVFDNVLSAVLDVKKRRILSNEELISIGIFAALIIAGMWEVVTFNLSLRNILSILFIIIAAHIGGVGLGAAMGILMGLVLSMAAQPDPILIAVLGVCGLIAGTFREMGKIFTGLTFLLANALMSFYISSSTVTIVSFREILASSILLVLIPQKALSHLRQFLDYSLMRFREQNFYINKMQELTVGRLGEFSRVFKELSAAFGNISQKARTGQDDIAKLFDIISSQVCHSCALYSSCWERDFCSTYKEMFDMVTILESEGVLEKKDIKGQLANKCINMDKLLESIYQVYGIYKSNLKWKSKIEECRQLVAQQLEGVSTVVEQLARELDISIEFKKDLEEAVTIELDKAGIRVKEVLVIQKSNGSMEVNIRKDSCSGRRDCTRKIQKIVSRTIGRRMTPSQTPCTALSKGECMLNLVEAKEFQVSTGIARKAGQSSGICGDSYSFNPLADGKYMLALSDGMGIGSKAADESRAVISLLENFLEAGFDMDTTIRSINSTLLLRSQDEIFATVDLCLLDLISGNADFVKIGAVSTFIKRKDYVEVVKASSLPIGILDNVQPEAVSLKLRDEDMIIMITDGVLDNTAKGKEAERWLAGIIDSLDTRNPQEMADYIMESVLKMETGDRSKAFGDDMTIMATRVWKPII